MLSFSGATFVLFCFVATVCVLFRLCSFFCFSGDVVFSKYSCTIIVLSLYGEYVVHFPLPDGVFLSCDHGLEF